MSESWLIHHTTTHEHQSRLQRGTVLAVASIAQFMVVLDVTIINVALPQMRTALHMSASGQQWVINAYALTFAGFLMLGGRAADLFGRRRVFIVGLATFTLFSLLGGFAQTGAELIAARAAQGIGGAILARASLSLLTATFTEHHERRRALGIWSATAASSGALVASRLVKRVGIRRQFVIAPLVTAAAVFWLSHLTAHSSYLGSLLVPLLLVGASIGVTFVPMTMAATMGVPPAESGLASGLLNTSRQVGGVLGLAVLATIATAATHHADGLGGPHLAALTHGYTRGFLLIAAISVLGAVSAAFLSTSTASQDIGEQHPRRASSSR